MSTCEAVGAHACLIAGSIGYLIFAAGWVFVTLAFVRATIELLDLLAKFNGKRSPLSPETARGSFSGQPGSRIAAHGVACERDRPSPALAIPPDASPMPAMSARVLAFAPHKTRNRVVVR